MVRSAIDRNLFAERTDLRVILVCPMANEADTAERFVEAALRASAVFDDVRMFCVVDKASTDATRRILEQVASRDSRVAVIWSPENRCISDAYLSGYRAALETGWPWILEIDAGFSHDPADIPKFVPFMSEDYDCIFGSRFCSGGSFTESRWTRRWTSRWGTWLTNLLLRTKLSDMTGGFQAFRGNALRTLLEKGIRSSGPFFQTELKIAARNMRVREVPIHYRSASRSLSFTELWDALTVLWALYRRRQGASG